jgi:hypothetical protein
VLLEDTPRCSSFVSFSTIMQVSRSEGEPSKWLAQSRNYSTIEALATELLLEIFKHLGWEDVLMTRRVSISTHPTQAFFQMNMYS